MATVADWIGFFACIADLAQRGPESSMHVTLKQTPFELAFKPVIAIPDLLPFPIPEIPKLPDFLSKLPPPPRIPAIPGITIEIPVPWPINVTVQPKVLLPTLPMITFPAFVCPPRPPDSPTLVSGGVPQPGADQNA